MSAPHDSFTIRIVRKFLESNLSMVFIIVSLVAGACGSDGHAARGGAADHRGRGQRDGLFSRPHGPGCRAARFHAAREDDAADPGRRVRVFALDAGTGHRDGAILPGAAAGTELRQDHPEAQRERGPDRAGRSGIGGQADRRGRRADRDLHPDQRCPRRLRAAAHGRRESWTACRGPTTPA